MVKRRVTFGTLLSILAFPLMATERQGSAGGFVDAAGPIAAAQLDHFWTITLLMLIVVVPIFLLVPWILLRYRRGGGGAYRPDWDFNWGIESVIWGVPIALILMLSAALWAHTRQYDPYRPLGPDPLVIEVVSLDWKFLFLYPEQGVATVDYLALPQDRPITLKLTSGTVMQSFMVPQLAGQIYTMAGMTTQLNLSADRPGQYVGRNTQYNGDGFATQSFPTVVMPQDEFNTWLASTRTTDDTLDWKGYQALLKPSIVQEARYFGSFELGLFDRVVSSFSPHRAADHPRPQVGQISGVTTSSQKVISNHKHNGSQLSAKGEQQ